MDVVEYLKRAEEIRKRELWSRLDLVNELGIVYNTLIRIEKTPAICSLKTKKKLKAFVEKWEEKHVNGSRHKE